MDSVVVSPAAVFVDLALPLPVSHHNIAICNKSNQLAILRTYRRHDGTTECTLQLHDLNAPLDIGKACVPLSRFGIETAFKVRAPAMAFADNCAEGGLLLVAAPDHTGISMLDLRKEASAIVASKLFFDPSGATVGGNLACRGDLVAFSCKDRSRRPAGDERRAIPYLPHNLVKLFQYVPGSSGGSSGDGGMWSLCHQIFLGTQYLDPFVHFAGPSAYDAIVTFDSLGLSERHPWCGKSGRVARCELPVLCITSIAIGVGLKRLFIADTSPAKIIMFSPDSPAQTFVPVPVDVDDDSFTDSTYYTLAYHQDGSGSSSGRCGSGALFVFSGRALYRYAI